MTNTPRLALPEPQTTDSISISPPAFATIWSNVDAAIGPTFCTSSTKPASPYACQWIYLTDLNAEQIWDPIASAWVNIKPNPTGIIGATTTVNNTALTTIATEYQIATVNNMTVEPFRNYKVHVEGICGFTFDATKAMAQSTQQGEAFLRYANAASVALTDTQFQQVWADAMQFGTGYSVTTAIAQQNFTFDGIYTGTSATQLSVGWSYRITGSFSANCSAQYVQNTLMYVEQV